MVGSSDPPVFGSPFTFNGVGPNARGDPPMRPGRRCQDWLNGVRLELWDPVKKTPSRASTEETTSSLEHDFDLDDRLASRVQSLISEGALRRACTALTCEPPVAPSPEVVSELSSLHPGPTKAHQQVIDQLREVGPGAVPIVDPDMVRRALSSFSPTSGAGPSGLRPSHLQEALRHSSGDQTLGLVSEVLQLMLRGEVPCCGSSANSPLFRSCLLLGQGCGWPAGAFVVALEGPVNSLVGHGLLLFYHVDYLGSSL